ncbi:MAG: hypothetical protein HDR04_09020 [Lachnospiraceae bacterium]|nr:hypothetical protein [Lachnospiraceae bacterium]
MFERFGEFDSADEINATAEGLLKEGDTESLYILAEENGLDREEAEDYINGDVTELTNALMAAYGKLDIENAELKLKEIMEDWLTYIRVECSENPKMAAAVRRKGKSLKGCIGAMMAWSFKHQIPIEKEIIKEAGVNAGRVTMGIPGNGTAKKIIQEYYLGKQG